MKNSREGFRVVDMSTVLDDTGHIKPELLAVASFGAEASGVWEEHGEAIREHIKTCETCRVEVESEEERMAS